MNKELLPDAETLRRINLKGYGPARLGKLSDETLEELCKMYAIDPVPEIKAERCSALLKARQRKSPLTLPNDTSTGDAGEEGDPTEPIAANLSLLNGDVFKTGRHGIKILSFNSLKLRLGREGLQEQWLLFVAVLATMDVVLVSEVPAGEARAKSQALIGLIQQSSKEENVQWTFAISEPSGPGSPEVHICLAKRPIKIVESKTLTHAGEVALDHAPLCVKLLDSRFSSPKTIVVTSLHLPPVSRSKARDLQIKAFFAAYAQQSFMRLEEPFTEKGAKDARKDPVLHVAAGDYNAYPAAVCNLEALGWGTPLVGSQVATSSGRKSFDHFVPSGYTAAAFNLSWEVLELSLPQNSRKGEIGLSDHDPIVLGIREVRTTTGAAAKVGADQKPKEEVSAAPACPLARHQMMDAEAPVEIGSQHFYLLGVGWTFTPEHRPLAPPQPKQDLKLFDHLPPPVPAPPPRPVSPGPPEVAEPPPRPGSPGPPEVAEPPEPDQLPQPKSLTAPTLQAPSREALLQDLNLDDFEGCQRAPTKAIMPKMDCTGLVNSVLVWDTESSGLSSPAVCQLSYVILKPGGEIVEYDKILKLPKGVRMSPDATKIHKITAEMAAKGADTAVELTKFFDLVAEIIQEGGKVVAHNAQFDVRAINFTAEKFEMTQQLQVSDCMCTMRSSSPHSPLKTSNGRRKPFKLAELYNHLFGQPPAWAELHNSLDDSRVLALCYLEGRKESWWE